MKRFQGWAMASLLVCVAAAPASAKGKKKQHKYLGAHPLSAKADDGYCYIDFPHVHRNGPANKHKALYREREGHSVFVADPTPYGYEEERHPYYGHHPIAVEVVVGVEPAYVAEQPLEFCYLNGPHHHAYAPQPGLTFESKGGVYWYIGDLPPVYKKQKARYMPVNQVYATVELGAPVVEIEAPPVGYVGPVLEIHTHGHGHGHGHIDAHGHVDAHVDLGVRVEAPRIEIGLGLPGIVVEDHGHGHKHKHKHHKVKYKKGKKHKGHKRGRKRGLW